MFYVSYKLFDLDINIFVDNNSYIFCELSMSIYLSNDFKVNWHFLVFSMWMFLGFSLHNSHSFPT